MTPTSPSVRFGCTSLPLPSRAASPSARLVGRVGDRLAYRGQFMDCRVRFEVGERVVSVEPYQIIAMPLGHRVVATSAWALATGRGSGYWGVTTAAWEGGGGDMERVTVASFELARDAIGKVSVNAAFRG